MALYFRSLLLLSLVSEANEGKEIENEIKTQPLEMTFMTSVFGWQISISEAVFLMVRLLLGLIVHVLEGRGGGKYCGRSSASAGVRACIHLQEERRF